MAMIGGEGGACKLHTIHVQLPNNEALRSTGTVTEDIGQNTVLKKREKHRKPFLFLGIRHGKLFYRISELKIFQKTIPLAVGNMKPLVAIPRHM